MSARYGKPFEEWVWRTYYDHIITSLDDFINKYKLEDDRYFFIGTDSQLYTKDQKTKFNTVLVAYQLHKGGVILSSTNTERYISSLRERLLFETWRSIELAFYLNDQISSDKMITIQLDINSNLKYKSAHYKDELVGMVVGQGFNAIIKPDAWAASGVADSGT